MAGRHHRYPWWPWFIPVTRMVKVFMGRYEHVCSFCDTQWKDAFDEISFTFWLEAICVPGHLGRTILDWCKDMRLELKVQGVSSLASETPQNSKWFLSKCRTGPRLPRKHTSKRVPSGPSGSSLTQCFGSVLALPLWRCKWRPLFCCPVTEIWNVLLGPFLKPMWSSSPASQHKPKRNLQEEKNLSQSCC